MKTLKERRKQLGMNQGELAEALGISQPMVSRMEKGTADVSRRTELALEALETRKSRAA